jgi:multidrug resistance efflux pump
MQSGHQAPVAFQGDPGELWPAHVHGMGAGVGQAPGISSGQLPDLRGGNCWIPPAHRFQVRLELDGTPPLPLRVGMTGSVSVYVEAYDPLNVVTKTVHRIVS